MRNFIPSKKGSFPREREEKGRYHRYMGETKNFVGMVGAWVFLIPAADGEWENGAVRLRARRGGGGQ